MDTMCGQLLPVTVKTSCKEMLLKLNLLIKGVARFIKVRGLIKKNSELRYVQFL